MGGTVSSPTPIRPLVFRPSVPADHPAVIQAHQYISCVFEPDDLVEVRVFRSIGGKPQAAESKFQAAQQVPEVVGAIALSPCNGLRRQAGSSGRKWRP